jgi:hypothetical protein
VIVSQLSNDEKSDHTQPARLDLLSASRATLWTARHGVGVHAEALSLVSERPIPVT